MTAPALRHHTRSIKKDRPSGADSRAPPGRSSCHASIRTPARYKAVPGPMGSEVVAQTATIHARLAQHRKLVACPGQTAQPRNEAVIFPVGHVRREERGVNRQSADRV